jgi:hypothetical protein
MLANRGETKVDQAARPRLHIKGALASFAVPNSAARAVPPNDIAGAAMVLATNLQLDLPVVSAPTWRQSASRPRPLLA